MYILAFANCELVGADDDIRCPDTDDAYTQSTTHSQFPSVRSNSCLQTHAQNINGYTEVGMYVFQISLSTNLDVPGDFLTAP